MQSMVTENKFKRTKTTLSAQSVENIVIPGSASLHVRQEEQMSRNLLERIRELQDAMDSCQRSTETLIDDYRQSVLQTAAVVAAAKIREEKVQVERKKELFRRMIDREREASRLAVEKVYTTAKKSIQALINDKNKELQEALDRMERTHKKEIARVKVETRQKTIYEFAAIRKRKIPSQEESKQKVSRAEEEEARLKCASCGKVSATLMMCSGCRTALYCDEICQERDWCQHAKQCSEDAVTD